MTDLEKRHEAVATLKQLGYMPMLWHTDDVTAILEAMGYYKNLITTEEAMEILENIERNHDATIGVNWDVIEYYVNEFIEEKELIQQSNDEDDE